MEHRIKSLFGDYATQLQVLADENLDKFKAPFYPAYFDMGIPQQGLTYATAIGRNRIEAAASVVAHGSEAPLRSRAGLDRLTGEVAAIKVKRKMDEAEYRNWMVMQALPVADETKKRQIIQLIWDDVKHVVDAVRSRVDIMVKQALSTGRVSINITNNPDGIIVGNLEMLTEDDNSGNPGSRNGTTAAFGNTGSGFWWGPGGGSGGGATGLNPIADIAMVVNENPEVEFEKILMTPTKWRQFSSRTAVTSALTTSGRSGAQPTLEDMNSFLVDRKLPYIEVVYNRHTIETNGVPAAFHPWANRHVVFVPSGKLGVIHNAIAIEEIAAVNGVDYALTDRVLVSKWSQTEPFGEFTRGELAAFPGFEASQNVLIVNTMGNTWA